MLNPDVHRRACGIRRTRPEWFPLDAVPLAEMWDDARRWYPECSPAGAFGRTFVFGEDLATVVHERDHVA